MQRVKICEPGDHIGDKVIIDQDAEKAHIDDKPSICAQTENQKLITRITWCWRWNGSLRRQANSSHGIDFVKSFAYTYRQASNISRILVGNRVVDNSDVVGASPVGAAPTTSSSST